MISYLVCLLIGVTMVVFGLALFVKGICGLVKLCFDDALNKMKKKEKKKVVNGNIKNLATMMFLAGDRPLKKTS